MNSRLCVIIYQHLLPCVNAIRFVSPSTSISIYPCSPLVHQIVNLIRFWIIWIEIVLRSNLEFVAISMFKAVDARIAQSTARLLTGKTPGYPKSITLVFEFGSAPKCAGDGEHFRICFNSNVNFKSDNCFKMHYFLLINFRMRHVGCIVFHIDKQHDITSFHQMVYQ